jgi:hypothetical protein
MVFGKTDTNMLGAGFRMVTCRERFLRAVCKLRFASASQGIIAIEKLKRYKWPCIHQTSADLVQSGVTISR